MTEDDLRAAVTRVLPGVTEDLVRLARIPSIAFDGFDHAEVERSAEAVADLLRGAGLPDVRIVRKNGQPAVIGRRPAPPGAPTVVLLHGWTATAAVMSSPSRTRTSKRSSAQRPRRACSMASFMMAVVMFGTLMSICIPVMPSRVPATLKSMSP